MKRIINIVVIIGITFLLAIGVKAAQTITASQITYNGSTVQAELDNIINNLDTYCPDGYDCTLKSYYEFGMPTISSSTNFQEVITSSGSKVFIKLQGEQSSVCIYRNSKLECFKNNNYEEESVHLKQVFGESSCVYTDNSHIYCTEEEFNCLIYHSGRAACTDISTNYKCAVNPGNEVECS